LFSARAEVEKVLDFGHAPHLRGRPNLPLEPGAWSHRRWMG
jgi:hypothetical protein